MFINRILIQPPPISPVVSNVMLRLPSMTLFLPRDMTDRLNTFTAFKKKRKKIRHYTVGVLKQQHL